MKKIIAGIVITLFLGTIAAVTMAYTDDKPKKAKTEQCCEKKECDKKECDKSNCKKECTSKCNSEKPCK